MVLLLLGAVIAQRQAEEGEQEMAATMLAVAITLAYLAFALNI
jgi:hypothetical protein